MKQSDIFAVERWARSITDPDTIDEIAAAVRESDAPWDILEAVQAFEGLAESQVFCAAVADALRNSSEPWRMYFLLAEWCDLAADDEVESALARSMSRSVRAMEASEEPWEILEALMMWPTLSGLSQHHAKIVRFLRESRTPWTVVRFISLYWPEIAESGEFIAALADAIRTSPMPSYVVWEASDCSVDFSHPALHDAVVHAIRECAEPWELLYIVSWLPISDSEAVKAAAADVAPRAAAEIRRGGGGLGRVLNAVQRWPGLREAEEVMDAVAYAIGHTPDPWGILRMVSGWSGLRASGAFVAAVQRCVHYLAGGIQASDYPWRILQGVSEYPELRWSGTVLAALPGVVPQIARQMRKASEDLEDVLEVIADWPEVRWSEAVLDAIAHAVRDPEEGTYVAEHLFDWPDVRAHAGVISAVAGILRETDDMDFWYTVSMWPELKESTEALSAVADSAPRIADMIWEAEEPWAPMFIASMWPELRRSPEVISAVAESTSRIIQALRGHEEYLGALAAASGWQDIPEMEAVHEAVAASVKRAAKLAHRTEGTWLLARAVLAWPELRRSPAVLEGLAESLKRSEEPWVVMEAMSEWSEVHASGAIVSAVEQSAPTIAHALLESRAPWAVLEGVSGWPQLRSSRDILDAVVSVLGSCTEPWWVLEVLSEWPEARASDTVQSAAAECGPMVARPIRYAPDPQRVVRSVEHWPVVMEHPAVRDALRARGLEDT